jgi:hypothetical protein
MGEMRNINKFFYGKPERKEHWGSQCTGEANIQRDL